MTGRPTGGVPEMAAGEAVAAMARPAVTAREAVAVFGRIGLLSFGGPAGQIALMHRVLVEEKGWLGERQFLHALNFCMLLPGPEAMQLATYSGWLVRGVGGGLLAGSLFVLPGFAVLVALSAVYAFLGDLPAVAGLLFGLKAAVLAIVVQALFKVGRRALHGPESAAVAVAAFLAIAVFRVPFPVVVLAAAGVGMLLAERLWPPATMTGETAAKTVDRPWRHASIVLACAAIFWIVPVALLASLAQNRVYAEEAVFFSKTAMVTFGGAYAVLAYVGQQAVEHYQWLRPGEMLAGLGLAETTPGPLILVLVFVGFIAAMREASGLDPFIAGLLGAIVTTWVTFVPCFVWIFLGAPFIERLRGNRRLGGAFAAITAAVVGVIANLSLWFALHVLFTGVSEYSIGWARVWRVDPATLDWQALAIALLAGAMVWRGAGLPAVLGTAVAAGLAMRLLA